MLPITGNYNSFYTMVLALLLDPNRDRQFYHWTLSNNVVRATHNGLDSINHL